MFSPRIEKLIEHFQCLPGVGPKTAQRLALHVLTRGKAAGRWLANSLEDAIDHVQHCTQCRMLTDTALCALCEKKQRHHGILCVVENTAEVFAIEHTHNYTGRYFVLNGHLSPLDGIGPDALGIDHLIDRVQSEQIQELILATNPTVEGEATAHYIAEQCKAIAALRITRIAYGVPVGSELEYIDGQTLRSAFEGRAPLTE